MVGLLLPLVCIHAKEEAPPVKDVNGEELEAGRRLRMRAQEQQYGGGLRAEYEKHRERGLEVRVERDVGDELELEKVEEESGDGRRKKIIELGDQFYVKVKRRASSFSREEGDEEYYWGLERKREEEGDGRHRHYYAVVLKREEKEKSQFAVMELPGGLYALQACIEDGRPREVGAVICGEKRNEDCIALGFHYENGEMWLRSHYKAGAIHFEQPQSSPLFSILG